MAKIYGLFGAMSGKVADVVMSVRNGQQIVRKYQPVVANPKTQNQFSTRARFKLISQLSAVMAPYIAIRRVGGVSGRNIFTKVNFVNSIFSEDSADINLSAVKLTTGVVSLPPIAAVRGAENITVSLVDTDTNVDRVIYVAFVREADGTLRKFASAVAEEPGAYGTFETILVSSTAPLRELYVYAYGVRDNTERARIRFSDMTIDDAADVAQVIVSSSLLESDITVTETKFFNLPAQQ